MASSAADVAGAANASAASGGVTGAKRARMCKEQGREYAAESGAIPKKKFYRQRAHCNPLNDSAMPVPLTPAHVDWPAHFPACVAPDGSAIHEDVDPVVRIADIGCGFGGMTITLSKMFPNKLIAALEIREQVTTYVRHRIAGLRNEACSHGDTRAYQNATAIRANTMKNMANFFRKGQLERMFFLFPDPHFKAANHRRRIINTHLLTEYAFFLQPGGLLYTITDVEEVGEWMRAKLEAHPLFAAVPEAELAHDAAAAALAEATEEGQKVARSGGRTWRGVYRRLPAAL